MKAFSLEIVAPLLIAMLSLHCGDDPTADCAVHCPEGCCDKNGNCLRGKDDSACGYGGVACQLCASGTSCSGGRCLTGGGCTAQSCAGCCTADDGCVLKVDETQCGARGALCSACEAGKRCVAGRCSDSLCVPETCPLGCCVGDQCLQSAAQSVARCGRGARPCGPCAPGQECREGVCIESKSCDATCTGCCGTDNKCIEIAQQSALSCGDGGQGCETCGAGLSCVDARCQTPTDWEVRLIGAQVKETDANGDAWDSLFGEPQPDVYVCVGLIGQDSKVCSAVAENSYAPTWDAMLTTFTHDELTQKGLFFELRDDDGVSGYPYESMGRCTIYPSQALTSGERQISSGDCDGSVLQLRIRLDRKSS